MPDKTNLFYQKEFLKDNEGTPAQDLVGSVFGYAVAHDQGCNCGVHKAADL